MTRHAPGLSVVVGGEREGKRCLSARRDERTESEEKETGPSRNDREHWGSRWERARRDEAGRGKFPLQSGRSCAADSAPRLQTVCAAAAAAVLFRCRKFLLGFIRESYFGQPGLSYAGWRWCGRAARLCAVAAAPRRCLFWFCCSESRCGPGDRRSQPQPSHKYLFN
jgi:hypothetical protein